MATVRGFWTVPAVLVMEELRVEAIADRCFRAERRASELGAAHDRSDSGEVCRSWGLGTLPAGDPGS